MRIIKAASCLVIICIACAVIYMPNAQASKKKIYHVEIGSYITPYSAWGKAINTAILKIKKKTKGQVVVKHLHSGMLGSNDSMLEQVLHGGIQGAGIDTSTLANFIPEMNILEMPFLFRDNDEAHYLIDNVITPHLRKKMDAKGLVTSTIMEIGFMDFLMSVPIHTPADLKKVKIGSWESPVHIAFWKAQGGNPIPIPATEVFSAYARGMVNGGSIAPNAAIAWDKLFGGGLKRNELYLTKIAYTYHAGIIVFNKKFYDSLPSALRRDLTQGLEIMGRQLRKDLAAAEPETYRQLGKLGYNIIELTPEQKQAFIDNSQVVYDEFESIIGKEFLKEVLDAREAYRKGK